MMPELYIGLMSGTSIDCIDAALVSLSDNTVNLEQTHSKPIDAALRKRILALCETGDDEIERMGALDRVLGQLLATSVNELLTKSGVDREMLKAIGSHGQTIRHRPTSGDGDDLTAFTCQIGDPNTIAELTGITTVADFRRRDIAAGGQGAPLVPRFHQAAFAQEHSNRAIINIGGMANVTLLRGDTLAAGFDTGRGNVLLYAGRDRSVGTR